MTKFGALGVAGVEFIARCVKHGQGDELREQGISQVLVFTCS